MVSMTAEAIDGRLRMASNLSKSLVGKPGPQAVSMSPEAITQRLHEWAQLTELCLSLGRDVIFNEAAEGAAPLK